jgi:hypothetical protein
MHAQVCAAAKSKDLKFDLPSRLLQQGMLDFNAHFEDKKSVVALMVSTVYCGVVMRGKLGA